MVRIFDFLQQFCSIEEMPHFAIRQGVAGLLYEEVKGMECCPFEEKGMADLVMYAEKQKKDWDAQKRDINTLNNICIRQKLKMLIFKGYAISKIYDIPESRKTGDVDCFFWEDKDTCKGVTNAGDIVDDFVTEMGTEVTKGWKHSSFEIRGTLVENHRRFAGWDEHPRLKAVDDFLLEQLPYSTESEWNRVYLPSANFHAMLLVVHMGEHFVYEGASLRQLVDWFAFVEKYGQTVDWHTIEGIAEKCGFKKWLDLLLYMASHEQKDAELERLSKRLLHELAVSKPFDRDARENNIMKYFWGRTVMAFRDRWKLRMVYDENAVKWYVRHARRYVGSLIPAAF